MPAFWPRSVRPRVGGGGDSRPLDGHHARALWALARDPPAFVAAHRIVTADRLSGRYWRAVGGLPLKPPDLSPVARQQFRLAVSRYYLTEVRVALLDCDRRLVLEADPASGAGDLGAMVDEFLPAGRYPRPLLHITQATVALKYLPAGADRKRTLTFDVS